MIVETSISKIKQEVIQVSEGDKYNKLLEELYKRKGLVTKVIGENYFAKAFCHENNKTIETLVFATLHPECKSTISSGDLVLVGIEQVGKIITREELRKHEGEKGEIFKDVIEDCPKGFILYKLKPILDVKTKKFLIDE